MNYDYWKKNYSGSLSKRAQTILKLNDIILGGAIIIILIVVFISEVIK